MQSAALTLSDGRVFTGKLSHPHTCAGEVVFTTGMTGYVEALTDPSFAGQILTFTYPLIGNYGTPDPGRWEGERIYPVGVIVSEACESWSHHAGQRALGTWLERAGVPLLSGVDTRALTKQLREGGALLGAIAPQGGQLPEWIDPNTRNLVAEVACDKVITYSRQDATADVILVDCGMKRNILRLLSAQPLNIRQVPWDYDYSEEAFDGVFLSNGPGDPAKVGTAVEILKRAMKRQKPIYGICLGAQLMAQAAGASTYKLPYGHRGHNQPVKERSTGRCYITSQNHGYAVDRATLPDEWEVTHLNLNDGSVEGIAHRKLPFRALQFHPEAAPGPTDTQGFFEQFYREMA